MSCSKVSMQDLIASSLLLRSALAALYLLFHLSNSTGSISFWVITRVRSPSLQVHMIVSKGQSILLCKVLTSLVYGHSLIWFDLILHYYLCSLDIEDYFPRMFLFEDDTHTLALRWKREVCQDLILFDYIGCVLNDYLLWVSLYQLDAKLVICKLYQCYLIWGARLELSNGWVLRVWVSRSHIVAECQACDHVSDHEVLLSSLFLGLRGNLVDPIVCYLC